jgi:hypothetical protein
MKHALQLPRKNRVAMATGCTRHHDGEATAAQSRGDAPRQQIEKLNGGSGRVFPREFAAELRDTDRDRLG